MDPPGKIRSTNFEIRNKKNSKKPNAADAALARISGNGSKKNKYQAVSQGARTFGKRSMR
jgi:hypothetical protein